MRLVRAVLLVAVVGWAAAPARADVKPHPLFTDNMVLQQGVACPVWGKADPGEQVQVSIERKTVGEGSAAGTSAQADPDGNWKVALPAQKAGTGYTLTVKGKTTVEFKNVAVGEVWVCSGQSNMEWSVNASTDPEKVKAGAKNPLVRLFTVQKRTATAPITDQGDLKHFSKWDECGPETVAGFSAVAYHFGNHLQKNLPGNVPVGLIHTSWGGTPAEAWTSTGALDAVPELKYYADAARKAEGAKQAVGPHTPASLYNAMIHPLLPFAIKGAIWYQGESNAGKASEYRTLFTTMIEDWRKKWGNEFPFLCVQLAPWHAGDADGVSWAELREAQLLATQKLKNVGMAVITDVGDLYDIHPRDKTTVGNRLGLYARGMTYGQKVVHSGPVYKAMKVDDDKAVLSFDHVGGGLQARYQTLNGFEVCGEDHEFYPAKAVIAGETVVVSSAKVKKPVAVRFGWKNYPVVNLFNKTADGKQTALPATPFRTDDFPLTTAPKPTPPKKTNATGG
ncbi:MAG: sialate O-acetylesterase [Gemmataceae bacterium]|nr:sialate O-acetylesterase [Gemmataceae bacterium]